MNPRNIRWKSGLYWLLAWLFLPCFAIAESKLEVTELFDLVRTNLSIDLSKSALYLEQINQQFDELSIKDQHNYVLFKATYLGLVGKHEERLNAVNSILANATEPNIRVKLLYEVSDAHVHIGNYEQALIMMNKGLKLLPRLTDINAKASMLQGGVTLLSSLNAFDEAREYADRIYQLGINANDRNYVCLGLANRLDVMFKINNSQSAHSGLNKALEICESSDFGFIPDMLRAKYAIDLIRINETAKGIEFGLMTLGSLGANYENSNYVTELKIALAKGYRVNGQLEVALEYGLAAFEHAKASKGKKHLRRASEELAQIKRAQGDFEAALDYYDIHLREKDSAEQDRFAKNLAYQRVKYDSLDNANQLELLKVTHDSLSLNQKLQQRNNENLILVVSLGTILLVFLSILLVLSTKRKQALLFEHPMDMPVGMSKNGDILAQQAYQEARKKQCLFGVMVFELDFMARYETLLDEQSCQVLLDLVDKACVGQLRESDQFGRINENRFVICLLESSEQGALALAERCQHLISQIELSDESIPTPITSTFGIAILPEHGSDYDDTIHAADKALQRAKEQGHNSIYVYKQEEEHDEFDNTESNNIG